MYIDTRSEDSIKKSICEYLNIKQNELDILLKVGDIDYVNKYLSKFKPKGYNLLELLTKESSLSKFLKKYKIEFVEEQGHLELYYKKNKQDIDYYKNSEYLKSRLGYNNLKDYNFCGLAFKDDIYKNIYAMHLSEGPEFLRLLDENFTNINLLQDYKNNSQYYCYEYLIPIEKVVIVEIENQTTEKTQKFIVESAIQKLYDYKNGNYIDPDDNPVLILKDNDIMQEKYFIGKEKIKKFF